MAAYEIINLGTFWKINLDHIVVFYDNNPECTELIRVTEPFLHFEALTSCFVKKKTRSSCEITADN
jgi:hypothetical protein